MTHIEVQSYDPDRWHIYCDRQALHRCCASSLERHRRPNPLDWTCNRCVYLTIQSLDLHGCRRLNLTAQLGNRAGIQRAVGVSGRLSVGEAADMHGRYDLRCAPAVIVEPGVAPV